MSRIPKFTTGKSKTTDEVPDIVSIPKRPTNNLRRSKSYTDVKYESTILGTTATSSLKKPPINLAKKPLISAPSNMRRSKSYTDIKFQSTVSGAIATSSLKKPPILNFAKKPVISAASKAVNVNSKSKVNSNNLNSNIKSSVFPKTGTKRTAEGSETDGKNKVVRRRVPEWDYKTRFEILNEKYTTLLNDHKNSKDKLSEFDEMKSKNEELTKNVTRLKNDNTTTLLRMSQLQERLQEVEKLKKENDSKMVTLIHSNEELMKNNTELENKYQRAIFDADCSRKELDILKDKYEEVCYKLNETTIEKENLKQEVFKAEKLRRILHNNIQDIKGNIRVFCRLRPPITEQEALCMSEFKFINDKTLEISKSRGSILPGGTMRGPEKQEFSFDKVFDQSTGQEEVFEELSQLIQSALDGYHVCVFAYGQTGSGKTHTMQGGMASQEHGMIPRSVNLIFDTKAQMEKKGWSYKIHASFLEIYNENILDLLNMKSGKSLEIRFNEGKGTTVSNLTVLPISSAGELMKSMMKANENRATAVTNFNEHSSRSHAVTKIYIEACYQEAKASYIGSVSLVDLAGSESAKFSLDERLTETKSINKSLSCLGTVMLALHKKDSHIPFRNSKLTYLLQSSLGGNCKCLMIVNISPNEQCYNETINALRFASKVKEVKTVTSKNKITSTNNF